MNSLRKSKRPERPIRYQTLHLGKQHIRVTTCRLRDAKQQKPLLIFNGIGASAELLEPLLLAIGRPVLTFDMPGVGGSSLQLLPRRMSQLASLATEVLDLLEIETVHVMGISWGGVITSSVIGIDTRFAFAMPT